jgi:hypothetical protein
LIVAPKVGLHVDFKPHMVATHAFITKEALFDSLEYIAFNDHVDYFMDKVFHPESVSVLKKSMRLQVMISKTGGQLCVLNSKIWRISNSLKLRKCI